MEADIIEEKREIRKRIRMKRESLSEEEVVTFSGEIAEHVIHLPEFERADAVLCYISIRNEVNCNNIMLTAVMRDKQIFLPKVEGDEMNFYQVEFSPEEISAIKAAPPEERPILFQQLLQRQLVTGYYDIPEPPAEHPLRIEQLDSCFMILPGLVYDSLGNRLGYGGGFYDRFLAQYPVANAAAAYNFQITDETIPILPTDIRPDSIVTETGVIRRSL